MSRSCAHLGAGPACLICAFLKVLFLVVAQGRRRNEHPLSGLQNRAGQRFGGIDPMTMHAHIKKPPAHVLHGEPVNEIFRRIVGHGIKHGSPRRQHQRAPPFKPPGRRFNPYTDGAFQLVGLIIKPGAQGFCQRTKRRGQSLQRLIKQHSGLGNIISQGTDVCLPALYAAMAILARAAI